MLRGFDASSKKNRQDQCEWDWSDKCLEDMMTIAPTIVLALDMAVGLLLMACAPPAPKVDPPIVSHVIEKGSLVAVCGTNGTLPQHGLNKRSAS